jgi:hypothetical protein
VTGVVGLPVDVDGVERDLAEQRGDVHVRGISNFSVWLDRLGWLGIFDFDGAWHYLCSVRGYHGATGTGVACP